MRPVYRYIVRIRDWLLMFVFLCIAGFAVLVYKTEEQGQKGGCQREIISKTISLDGAWIALVHEDVCSDGFFTTVVVDTVQLVRAGEQAREGDVFTIDSGGDPQSRPVIHWLAPRLLQIVIPNKSLIGLSKEKLDDVTVRVKFYPDDPEERKRWLKEIERGPK